MNGEEKKEKGLSQLMVWALAFGCIIGWGAFVMPGTTFLPGAGPVGTGVAVLLGAAFSLVIAANYHFMINRQTKTGGAFVYAREVLGSDQAFVCAWFLLIAYVTVIPLNASAISFVVRHLILDHYWFGIFAALISFSACVVLSIRYERLAWLIQTGLVLVLAAGIFIFFARAMFEEGVMEQGLHPGFAPGGIPFQQTVIILTMMPWAFIGFDTVSHVADRFDFNPNKAFRLMAEAIAIAGVVYIVLTVIPAAVISGKYGGFLAYLEQVGNQNGIETMPVFYAAELLFGDAGFVLLMITSLAAIFSCMIGFCLAAARLLKSLAKEDFLPEILNRGRGRAIFIGALSLLFLLGGERFSDQLVELCSIGAATGFFFTSDATRKKAEEEKNRKFAAVGILGMLLSAILGLYQLVQIFINAHTGGVDSFLLMVFISCYVLAAAALLYRNVRRREDRLEKAKLAAEQKIKEESRVIYNMARDLRTPVNAVIGFSDQALKSGDDVEVMRDHLGKIRESGEQLLTLMNDIRKKSRPDSAQAEPEDAEENTLSDQTDHEWEKGGFKE